MDSADPRETRLSLLIRLTQPGPFDERAWQRPGRRGGPRRRGRRRRACRGRRAPWPPARSCATPPFEPAKLGRVTTCFPSGPVARCV